MEQKDKAISEQPISLVEAARLVFLDPAKLKFERSGATLQLSIEEGETYEKVTVLRAFPLSAPQQYLSIRDEKNEEIGLITEPERLSQANRALIDEALQRHYLIPIITEIFSAKERFGTVDWEVKTDRGERQFTTKNLRENVQRPAPGRIILNDIDENRYDIPDIDALNRDGQALLYRHL